jgi:hypothetical protein
MLTAHEIKLRFDASVGSSAVVSPCLPGSSLDLNARARQVPGELRIPAGGSAFSPPSGLSAASATPALPPVAATRVDKQDQEE